MVVYCTVCLNNTRKTKNISYFNYPKEHNKRHDWLKAVGREDLLPKLVEIKTRQQYRICEEHFEKNCIKFSKNGTVKYLFDFAFPTLKLPSNEDESSSSIQENISSLSTICMGEPRREVSYGQLERLWELLNRHREIALGHNKSIEANQRMWEEVAMALNSYEDGPVKNWKEWSKYWNDYKSELQKYKTATKSAQDGIGESSSVKNITDIDKKFLQMLGLDFGYCLLGLKVQPFEEESPTELVIEIPQNFDIKQEPLDDSDNIQINQIWISSTRNLSPSLSSPQLELIDRDTPSSDNIPIKENIFPKAEPTSLQIPKSKSIPEPSKLLRRRRFRGEPPMTQETARRNLVANSQRRLELDHEKCHLLKTIVIELEELKELIRSG